MYYFLLFRVGSFALLSLSVVISLTSLITAVCVCVCVPAVGLLLSLIKLHKVFFDCSY